MRTDEQLIWEEYRFGIAHEVRRRCVEDQSGNVIYPTFLNVRGKNLESLIPVTGFIDIVKGNVYCGHNYLENLEGCPEDVSGLFCEKNKLKSLKGCPSKIKTNFDCSINQLTSLEHCPKFVGGAFRFENNPIKTFKFLPEYVGGFVIEVESFKKFDITNEDIGYLLEKDYIRKNKALFEYLYDIYKPEWAEGASLDIFDL